MVVVRRKPSCTSGAIYLSWSLLPLALMYLLVGKSGGNQRQIITNRTHSIDPEVRPETVNTTYKRIGACEHTGGLLTCRDASACLRAFRSAPSTPPSHRHDNRNRLGTTTFIRLLTMTMINSSWVETARARIGPRPVHLTRVEYREQLGSEIRSLETILAHAKERLNFELPIETLPDEIILHIMTLLRDTAPRTEGERPARAWTDITAVCRRFREIGRSSALWSSISDATMPPSLLHLALVRSSPSLLDLDFSGLKAEQVPLCALENHTRIRSLALRNVHGNSTLWEQYLRVLPQCSTLTHLSIIRCYGAGGYRDSDAGKNNITQIDPPSSLKSLLLEVVPFSWQSHVYDNLFELILVDIEGVSCPTVAQFKDLFARTSRLACLEFRGTQTMLRAAQPSRFSRLMRGHPNDEELDELSTLYPPQSLRRWVTRDMKAFNINPYAFTPSFTISYEIRLQAMLKDVGFHLDAVMPRHMGSSSGGPLMQPARPVLAMRIEIRKRMKDLRCATVSFWRGNDNSVAPDFLVEIAMHKTDSVCDIFHSVDTSSVADLSLNIEPGAYSMPWFDLFTLMPAIRKLEVTEDELVDIICSRYNAYGPDGKSANSLHIDETLLYLETWHIRPSERDNADMDWKYIDGQLLYWLDQRQEFGLALTELRAPTVMLARLDSYSGAGKWRSYLTKVVSA